MASSCSIIVPNSYQAAPSCNKQGVKDSRHSEEDRPSEDDRQQCQSCVDSADAGNREGSRQL